MGKLFANNDKILTEAQFKTELKHYSFSVAIFKFPSNILDTLFDTSCS